MGGESPTMGLSFDMPFPVNENMPAYKKVAFHTLNWIDTNKKGMAFGLLFAASLMVFFSLIKNRAFKNRWLNTIFGIFVGAPLGVCVNCAAPIAQGMKEAGSRSETALATMISSPTLNMVGISMLLAMFPFFFQVFFDY